MAADVSMGQPYHVPEVHHRRHHLPLRLGRTSGHGAPSSTAMRPRRRSSVDHPGRRREAPKTRRFQDHLSRPPQPVTPGPKVIRWQADPERRAARGPSTGSGAAATLCRASGWSRLATTWPQTWNRTARQPGRPVRAPGPFDHGRFWARDHGFSLDHERLWAFGSRILLERLLAACGAPGARHPGADTRRAWAGRRSVPARLAPRPTREYITGLVVRPARGSCGHRTRRPGEQARRRAVSRLAE
jgi:hypothetical protein